MRKKRRYPTSLTVQRGRCKQKGGAACKKGEKRICKNDRLLNKLAPCCILTKETTMDEDYHDSLLTDREEPDKINKVAQVIAQWVFTVVFLAIFIGVAVWVWRIALQ